MLLAMRSDRQLFWLLSSGGGVRELRPHALQPASITCCLTSHSAGNLRPRSSAFPRRETVARGAMVFSPTALHRLTTPSLPPSGRMGRLTSLRAIPALTLVAAAACSSAGSAGGGETTSPKADATHAIGASLDARVPTLLADYGVASVSLALIEDGHVALFSQALGWIRLDYSTGPVFLHTG